MIHNQIVAEINTIFSSEKLTRFDCEDNAWFQRNISSNGRRVMNIHPQVMTDVMGAKNESHL